MTPFAGTKSAVKSRRLPNGIITHRPIIGVDWNRTQVDVFDGEKFYEFPGLIELANSGLFRGFMLVIESTAESFELQNRQTVLDALLANDIVAYCLRTQFTARMRLRFGYSDKVKGKTDMDPAEQIASDKVDAKVIYRIATEEKISLHVFGPLPEDQDKLRLKINDFLIEDRFLHGGDKSYKLAEKHVHSVPPEMFEMFYTAQKRKGRSIFRAQIGRMVVAALFVKEALLGYREFRKQVGNYGSAYGCMIRSEFYHGWVRIITNSRLDLPAIKDRPIYTPEELAQHRAVKKQTMKDCIKAAQFIWQLILQNGH